MKAHMWQKEAKLRKDWNTVKLWDVWSEGETKGNAPHILEKKWKAALQASEKSGAGGGATKSALVNEFSAENLNASPISNSSNPNSRPEFYKQTQFPDVFDPKTGKKIGYSVDFPKKLTFKKGRIGGRRRRRKTKRKRKKRHKHKKKHRTRAKRRKRKNKSRKR